MQTIKQNLMHLFHLHHHRYCLLVDKYTISYTSLTCCCWVAGLATYRQAKCLYRTVGWSEVEDYIRMNKDARVVEWIMQNRYKTTFLNVLAEIINTREGRLVTYSDETPTLFEGGEIKSSLLIEQPL